MGQRTTESEVGFLSKLVTILYTKKAEDIVKNIEDGMDVDMAVDHRVLQAMGKWVLDNGVFAAPDSQDTESPLQARLKEIQARSGKRVLDFKKEAKERGQG